MPTSFPLLTHRIKEEEEKAEGEASGQDHTCIAQHTNMGLWRILPQAGHTKLQESSGIPLAQWFSNFSSNKNHLRACLKIA